MPKSRTKPDTRLDLLARDLLQLYDDLSALNACTAFVLQALVRGDGTNSRSAEGAMFCTQWLSDRTIELERRLKGIQRKVHSATRRG